MKTSGVTFGTSGARGLVQNLTDRVCYVYTKGFLQYLSQVESKFSSNTYVGIAGDLRSSTSRIMAACAQAVQDMGFTPVNCGYIPTPAITAWGLSHNVPTLMVTGSHIPDDRNGIKFNDSNGEILKDDEAGISNQRVALFNEKFDDNEFLIHPNTVFLSNIDATAEMAYCQRYINFFTPNCLAGLRVGLYQHSSVSRDILYKILTTLGASVTVLGRSEQFIPVDTEAIRMEDYNLAREWAKTYNFNCIVSTDGDGDRPLIADENGAWLRGDITGILTARYLGIQTVVTPISSNTAVELCDWFPIVKRTRIGSPYVIVSMAKAVMTGLTPVAGYEANGGFLLASPINCNGRNVSALPTRDAIIVILSVLLLARDYDCSISSLVQKLPQRFTASGRLQNFPVEISCQYLEFSKYFTQINTINTIDGLRMTFDNGEILHLRPSGNAPEFRVYAEADSSAQAEIMVQHGLNILKNNLLPNHNKP